MKPKIFVWNNNPAVQLENDLADLVINSSVNLHCWPTVLLWHMAETPYVARMDDDLYFADDRVLEDALEVLKAQKSVSQIVGAWGVKLYDDVFYSSSHHIATPKGHGQLKEGKKEPLGRPHNIRVDIIKGRIMLLNRSATGLLSTRPVRLQPDDNHFDLYVSNTLAGRNRFWHTVAGCFWDHKTREGRLLDFPEDEKGYCAQASHASLRDRICDLWVKQCAPDPRSRRKPPAKKPGPTPPSVES